MAVDFITQVLSNDPSLFISTAVNTVVASVPAPPNVATVMPPPAALDSSLGTSTRYAREDHTHQVKVQRAVVTTDSNGNATMTFARPFVNPPAVTAIPNNSGNPIVLSIISKTNTQVTINAKQARTLPATIALLSALVNYNIFNDNASGIQIDIFAAEVTQ